MTWASRHSQQWSDLDELEERCGSACGFVLWHDFETLLQNISADYLCSAWQSLAERLDANGLQVADLSWGWMHPGYTIVANKMIDSPSDYLGWISESFWDFDRARKTRHVAIKIDNELRSCDPPMAIACCDIRAQKWNIAPDDFATALRLIEAMCTDEISDWAPDVVLARHIDVGEPRVQAAEAIAARSQSRLDDALSAAKRCYSAVGYRIVVRGFAAFVDAEKAHSEIDLRLPAV